MPSLSASLTGIIPAYAGSTRRPRHWPLHLEDHPRVCGEHVPAKDIHIWEMGSSPRMRGAPVEGVVAFIAAGIIPAYAGSTYLFRP